MKNEKSFPILSTIGVWFLLALFANINGVIRVYLIVPLVGETAGHVISCFTFSAIIFVVTYLFIKRKSIINRKTLIKIGLLWLLMTITFEFIFGHFVMNHSWEKLLQDYNIFAGRLWIVVLAVTFISPFICGSILNEKSK